MTEKLLINIKEVAELLGVSLRKMELLIEEGNAPKFVRIGRVRKWRPTDVADWVDNKFNEPAS